MAARSCTARILNWKKLYCLAGPTPLGVSALTGRSRDEVTEARGQRPADAEAEGQRSEGQISEGQRGLESKSGGPKPAESGPELEDK